jgi:cardiolipin synthase
MRSELKKEIVTIPNIITLLRIVAIPFFVFCTLTNRILAGFIILTLAAASDLLDGFIARHFNQVSQIGKALDPLADKLMHICALVALAIIGHIWWGFVALLFLKEAAMIAGSVLLIKRKKIIQANNMGKIASLVVTLGVGAAFFHDFFAEKLFYLDWIVLSAGLVLTYVAFFIYLNMMMKALRGEQVKGGSDLTL